MKLTETNRIGLLTILTSPFYAVLSVAVLQKAYGMDGVPGCVFLSPFLLLVGALLLYATTGFDHNVWVKFKRRLTEEEHAEARKKAIESTNLENFIKECRGK
ncbi:hypothetical protein [Escherichia phage vB_EcoM-ZQ3]|uniref:Uncharacterized protein n=1 Tax=Escherichia phage vB_EcoM-ZQ3 TaxID=2810369 RepID=A0A8F3HM70_9CAUD|nr:hypothetical protein [Escherichia phage vB_EcoM-ZQ3]